MSNNTDSSMSITTTTSSSFVGNSIPPNHTLYVNNLNGKIKKQQLRKSLYNLFVTYGRVLGIIAMKGVKMRGQAFIVFDDIQNSTAALRSLQGVVFYGKPMRLSYAKRDSDAIRFSKDQIAEKTAALAATSQPEPKQRKDKPRIPPPPAQPPPDRTLHEQHIALMNSEEVNRAANAVAVAEAELQELPLRDRTRRIQSVIAAQTTMIGTSVPVMTEVQLNSTLFVSNLPHETTREALEILFRQFSGYRDVRLVPGREGIAFIDFDNETGAASARDALNGFKISTTNAIAVSFAKK
jgi:U2 small nuclear ribonucleoprotein B''